MKGLAGEIKPLLFPDLQAYRGRRVIAAMSGGVDSSVVAALLADAGVEVIGVFLHVWDYRRENVIGHGSCCSLDDAYDARRVADAVGIPFYSLDMREAFRRDVVDPFVADYESGRTPNPCERCNRFVKFGALLRIADQLDADFVATGHYVRRLDSSEGVRIYRGEDERKDQSYFLATTERRQIERILFPVGHLRKQETRKLAECFSLPTAAKSESQDICFIPAGDRIAFLRQEGSSKGLKPGEIVDREGRLLGQHQGIAHFTLGQRKGLGLADGPWHVVALDGNNARVVVARAEDARIRRVVLEDVVWIRPPGKAEALSAKVRYQMPAAACMLSRDGKSWVLDFAEPQKPTAPGQVAAIYAGEELLGGGIVAAC